jgi:cellobiose-specific phosphotransferase system component IIB
MQKAATEQGIEADIAAYPEAEVTKVGGDADII